MHSSPELDNSLDSPKSVSLMRSGHERPSHNMFSGLMSLRTTNRKPGHKKAQQGKRDANRREVSVASQEQQKEKQMQ